MGWDERYQENDTPWDKGAPAPPLLELLKAHREFFGLDTVLVPGCGTGHDARAIAEHGFATVGVDLSATALKRAHERNSATRLEYIKADFLASQPENVPVLSAIFEHTCFCAIQPSERSSYRDACARLLPSGGYWVAIIFINPRDEDDPTIGPPFQSSREEVVALFDPQFELIHDVVPSQAFTARKGREHVMVWQKK